MEPRPWTYCTVGLLGLYAVRSKALFMTSLKVLETCNLTLLLMKITCYKFSTLYIVSLRNSPQVSWISVRNERHIPPVGCVQCDGRRGRGNSWLQRDIASAAHAQNAASPTTEPLHHNNIDQLTLWLPWRHVNKAAFSCAESPCLQGFSLPLGLLCCQRSLYITVSAVNTLSLSL